MFTAVWLDGRRAVVAVLAGMLVLGAAGAGGYLLGKSMSDDGGQARPAPAPKPPAHAGRSQSTDDLGFPAFATKNTTRVAGVDPIADAAGVALAVFPSTGAVDGPDAVTLIDAGDWASGVAAASLMANPVGAPILLTDAGSIPDLTATALDALEPGGSPSTGGHQAFVVGTAAAPPGFRTERVSGSNPAQLAAAIDKLRQTLSGIRPAHILLVSSEQPQLAMPAAAWAARSGDPILFVHADSVPKPTLAALRADKGVPVYALGPTSAISDKALAQLHDVAPGVKRVGAENPVANSIAFARYVDGTFGWNINDPGHGFAIANVSRPADAAAAAALSASGDWGPLLVTDDGAQVPSALRNYLLDVKPGYVSDPTRAVYNHIWVIGDQSAVSVDFQAEVDDLAEVAQVQSGTGQSPAPQGQGTVGPTKPSKP
ncbi:MAG: cell wall-binding repeat-containing protein [Solirubrobacterales bacterium]